MVSLSSLLGACPNGAWVTEDVAMEVLGVASKDVLQKKFSEGLLPHVHVEHGNRVKASPPYDKHRFFYIQKAGSNASPAVGLGDWLDVMAKVDTAGTDLIDSEAADVIKKVTNGTDAQNAFKEMQKVNAVVSSSSLSIQGSVGTSSDGYNYGTSGGSARVPSKSSAKDGEIYVRADGKKVRRVKKSKSSGGKSSNLSNFLDGADRPKKKFGSKSVVGDGEIYVRADGKKVRRVRKSSQSVGGSGASVGDINATPKKKSLGGFLDKDGPSITKIGESNSVAGDMIATRDLTGEIYVRADGKKVRRVKKIASTDGSNVEIITRPDGTKVKRIRKVKTVADSSDAASTEGRFNGLSGFLEKGTGGVLKKKFSGSHSVAGDQNIQGEIYVRSDGKKVRRVKKAKPLSSAAGATVAADTNPEKTEEKPETEIYTRPDGTKVRRIRRTAKKKVANTENSSSGDSDRKKSLAGFLSKAEPTKPKIGGSASVAGDMIATRGLTGEVYVRADGKKVRRVKKIAPKEGKADESSNVEIITRPDGKKVRRIRKTKVKPKGLSGFLDSQPKSKQIGGAATVGGDIVSKKEVAPLKPLTGELRKKQEPEEKDKPKETQAKKTLEGFLSRMDSKPKLMGQSASVAGDQIAVAKGESLTGEVYVRSDGKKVRRVKKSSAVQPGDQVEIITRPDGTKVRRIKRAKKPTGDAASVSSTPGGTGSGFKKSLAGFLSKSPALKKAGSGSASVSGDMLHRNVGLGEIYVRADGKKVRRVRKSVSGASVASGGAGVKGGEEYEIYTRADGKKVRRIRRKKEPAKNEQSLSSMLQKDKNIARPGGGAATVGDIGVKSTLKATPAATVAGDLIMNKDAVKSETATTRPTSAAPPIAAAEPAVKYSKLSSGDETTASQYRLMLKRGLPEGAVHHKMLSDGVAQNIIDSVLAREAPAGATPQQFPADANVQVVPNGMVLVPKDQAAVPDGMVLVPKEQAQRTIPEGMIVVDKGKETVPDGFVLVPKDKVKGDIGDDLILVNKSQVRDSTFVLGAKDDKDLKEDVKEDDEIKAAKNSNVITIDDLPGRVEMLKAEGKTFLLQALPNDSNLQNDFIKKNLLPKDIKAARTAPTKKAPAPATSGSIAEILAKMSTMGGDFDAEKMGELLSKLQDSEKRQKKLEKQLAAAGVAIAEDIDYDICIKKIGEIGKRMGEIGSSDVTHPDKKEQNKLREEYFKLEQGMEKYSNALMLTDEYIAEQKRKEKEWEETNAPGNLEALRKVRRHMPVEVRNMSEFQLANDPSPNGKYLPASIAKKFKRTNVLQIIRRDPDDLVRMHPSTLENMRVTGLTLTERRAVYEHVRKCGPIWESGKAEKMTERKWTWYNMMRSNFKENLASYKRHIAQYGPPGNHPYATRANPNKGCPLLGKQCPLKADKLVDYDKQDYGWTDEAVYEVSDVKKASVDDSGAKAKAEALELMKEKKANERAAALKKHYKGKLLQVSKANGSCESMDECMDNMEFGLEKWIEDAFDNVGAKLTDDVKKKEAAAFNDVFNSTKLGVLDFCGRAGMQLSGKKTADQKPDPRSLIEACLSEEVREMFQVFAKWIGDRLKKTEIMDTKIKNTTKLLTGLLDELHARNEKVIKALGKTGKRLDRSRALKTIKVIEKEVKEKVAARAPPEPDQAQAGSGPGGMPGRGGGGRGGLLDALSGGRGRGRGGGRGGLLDAIGGRGRGRGGGRGGLLDAIAGGRGRGRGGRGGGGRGGLLDAIAAGRGRGGRGGGGGGRGGLLDAISAGRGRGGGRGGGGRGGLMDAIQGRGQGRGGRGGGGRGDLMAAIAARGGG